MSRKQPRSRLAALTSPAARRAAMSVVVAGLATTLVVVFINRNGQDTKEVTVSTPSTTTPAPIPPAALNATYDVTVTVTSAEYGASWPGTQLTAAQQFAQQWTITCRRDTCVVKIASNHVVEDADGASLATADDKTFLVSSTTPATPDAASSPAGCGTVNATDLQRLTLTAVNSGATFTGRYELHHPTVHVEGPVADGVGSCDSFNVVLDLTAVRH